MQRTASLQSRDAVQKTLALHRDADRRGRAARCACTRPLRRSGRDRPSGTHRRRRASLPSTTRFCRRAVRGGDDARWHPPVRRRPAEPATPCAKSRSWWEIQQNQRSRLLDARLEAAARTRDRRGRRAGRTREPRNGEAWFYLAGAYAPLSQWRVLRGERLAAARDGKRIKDALERALALDPTLQDA